MKGALFAGVLVALAVTAVESLNCTQCYAREEDCVSDVMECNDTSAQSCVDSSVSSTLGGNSSLYRNKFCSAQNCSRDMVAFAVNVSENQSFHFASQCCQGQACNGSSHDPESEKSVTNTQCNACYGYNSANCTETVLQCGEGQRCVHIIADFTNGTEESNTVELKGCSGISNSTCEFLSVENQTVGEVIFRKVECLAFNVSVNSTEVPPTVNSTEVPPTVNSTTVTITSSTTSRTPATSSSRTGANASLFSLALTGLLLLKLL
ncbi:ly6/PLAUR domain-containing protein 8 [Nannospalax galili]|uniref:ly6/PLAUR domain-containing protein 8 n=1 Tax=Nannospalax galili TaxID=1026970 RepID=UPI0004ED416F|nr:ly6/PLAUR domain-containing protein 8 [Nannospalax galili]